MIYTPVKEYRYGSFLGKWLSDVKSYDHYRGLFGYGGHPVMYYTSDDRPFCLVIFSDVRLTGMFEHHEKTIICDSLFELSTQ